MKLIPDSRHYGRCCILLLVLLCSAWGSEPLIVQLDAPKCLYVGGELVVDAAKSSSGTGITWEWSATFNGKPIPFTETASGIKVKAESTGRVMVNLKVSRDGVSKVGKATASFLKDSTHGYPDHPGYEKITYKKAPDALGGLCELPVYVKKPENWKPEDKRSAFLFIHGGGFQTDNAAMKLPMISYFASRGLVGFTINYRLLGQQLENDWSNIRLCTSDARSAVRWIRTHAAELGIDPNRIAVGGDSAGAHLAACAANISESVFVPDPQEDVKVSCRPNVLLLYYPACMVMTGATQDLSPLRCITADTPPTLFMAGELDVGFPIVDGFRWRELMAKAGNKPCEFFIMRGTPHGGIGMNLEKDKASNDMVRQADIFMVRNGFMSGPPTLPEICDKDFHVNPADWQPSAAQKVLSEKRLKEEEALNGLKKAGSAP